MRTKGPRAIAVLLVTMGLGGCIADAASTGPNGSTSSRRSKTEDPDTPRQVCVDTLEGGSTKTVCY